MVSAAQTTVYPFTCDACRQPTPNFQDSRTGFTTCEECDWTATVLAFPGFFPAADVEAAQQAARAARVAAANREIWGR